MSNSDRMKTVEVTKKAIQSHVDIAKVLKDILVSNPGNKIHVLKIQKIQKDFMEYAAKTLEDMED